MQDSDFQELVDEFTMQLEDALEEYPEDLDIENAGGILTLVFPNGSSIVVSRQVATHEIWIAAKSGGFHLANNGDDWVCATTKENLQQLIARVVSEQLGRDVDPLA